MIKAYSQRALQPYSAQVQIAESDSARALTMDGEIWEFQYIYSAVPGSGASAKQDGRRVFRAAHIRQRDLDEIVQEGSLEGEPVDERIVELASFLVGVRLPFPAADRYEYWLLDAKDGFPLALIFSCVEAPQMSSFPKVTEWTALPAAQMPIATSELERTRSYGPVNYRLERCVAERAGPRPEAQWFARGPRDTRDFPALLVREDWDGEECNDLCRRYLDRQSPRLLMLHGLSHDDRSRMELAAKAHALDVARFYPLYPAIADRDTVDRIRVEAQLRMAAGEQAHTVGGFSAR